LTPRNQSPSSPSQALALTTTQDSFGSEFAAIALKKRITKARTSGTRRPNQPRRPRTHA